MVDVDASVDRVFTVPHVESVIPDNDLIADRLPLSASVKPLIHPAISAEGSFPYALLDA